jgi:hypothetical protein
LLEGKILRKKVVSISDRLQKLSVSKLLKAAFIFTSGFVTGAPMQEQTAIVTTAVWLCKRRISERTSVEWS